MYYDVEHVYSDQETSAPPASDSYGWEPAEPVRESNFPKKAVLMHLYPQIPSENVSNRGTSEIRAAKDSFCPQPTVSSDNLHF